MYYMHVVYVWVTAELKIVKINLLKLITFFNSLKSCCDPSDGHVPSQYVVCTYNRFLRDIIVLISCIHMHIIHIFNFINQHSLGTTL
jgi:hypothetical protein